jgi:hypothetical protein
MPPPAERGSRPGTATEPTSTRILTTPPTGNVESDGSSPTVEVPTGDLDALRALLLRRPRPSTYTAQLLAEAAEADRRLVVETGYTSLGIQQWIERATPDQLEQAVTAGFRWARYWRPASVLWREELEARERARLAIESSHEISRLIGTIGPSHAELQRLRAVSAWTYPCNGSDRCAECDVFLRHCKIVVTLFERLTADGRAWCERHEPGREKPAWCMQHRPSIREAAA